MSSLRSLLRRGDSGTLSPVARRVAVVLAVLTPLLIAGVAVTALDAQGGAAAAPAPMSTAIPGATVTATPSPTATATPSPTATAAPGTDGDTAAGPVLPAAVVNLDQLVYLGDDGSVTPAAADGSGTGTPVLAGKLLVSELTAGTSGGGFTWTVTDAATAADGLGAGRFAAVVTIPKEFSASYATIGSTDATQAELQVQTNGATSYVTGLLASALSADLQSALSEKATQAYIAGLLGGFTQLHEQLATAAGGAGELAAGATTLAGYQGEFATGVAGASKGATDLNTAVQGLAVGMRAIATGTDNLPVYADELARGAALVDEGVSLASGQFRDRKNESEAITVQQSALAISLGELYDLMEEDDPHRQAVGEAAAAAGVIAVEQGALTGLLAVDYDLVDKYLVPGASLVSSGSAAFAEDLPLLTTTLTEVAAGTEQIATGTAALASGIGELSTAAAGLATGSVDLATNTGKLATGLDEAATAVPSYTAAQQQSIATVAATPVVTEQSDIEALPTPAAAIAAVAVPLGLWIGAFAIYLLLAPFSRRDLASTASTFRVVIGSLVPAAILALVQAAVVAIVLFAVGAHPAHVLGGVLFSIVMSISFVMLHQGLVALFGQAGRLISLALVVVQVAAAAVILPNGLSAPFYTGLAQVLPLSHAITGMQALIGGGTPGAAMQSALVLLVFAAIGLALSLIAATRARSRSAVAVAAPA